MGAAMRLASASGRPCLTEPFPRRITGRGPFPPALAQGQRPRRGACARRRRALRAWPGGGTRPRERSFLQRAHRNTPKSTGRGIGPAGQGLRHADAGLAQVLSDRRGPRRRWACEAVRGLPARRGGPPRPRPRGGMPSPGSFSAIPWAAASRCGRSTKVAGEAAVFTAPMMGIQMAAALKPVAWSVSSMSRAFALSHLLTPWPGAAKLPPALRLRGEHADRRPRDLRVDAGAIAAEARAGAGRSHAPLAQRGAARDAPAHAGTGAQGRGARHRRGARR
jgi:hypothetical protein